MKTNFEEIVKVGNIGKPSMLDLSDMNSIISLAGRESFSSANTDAIKRLVLAIDVQNDFIEGGALEVPGSIQDVERMTRFIYNNMGGITRIMCSQDTHSPHQIFHPCWWANEQGDHPKPYTIITYADVEAGRWRPVIGKPVESLTYLQMLESNGNKQLCIWPYHCLKGTAGYALENEFAKMVYFHSVARKTANKVVPKGEDPYSEMYGIIKPEYSRKNFLNMTVLNEIERFEEIYVVGEAASHCLLESVKQIADYFKGRPEIIQRITILEDCTSPIPGCEADTAAAFDSFRNSGIKFAKSTDIVF